MTDENRRAHYAREKFYDAIYCLVGAADIRARLTAAANYLLRLQAVDLPHDLQERFEDMRAKLRSAKTMDDLQCSKLSQEVLSIYIGLRGGI